MLLGLMKHVIFIGAPPWVVLPREAPLSLNDGWVTSFCQTKHPSLSRRVQDHADGEILPPPQQNGHR